MFRAIILYDQNKAGHKTPPDPIRAPQGANKENNIMARDCIEQIREDIKQGLKHMTGFVRLTGSSANVLLDEIDRLNKLLPSPEQLEMMERDHRAMNCLRASNFDATVQDCVDADGEDTFSALYYILSFSPFIYVHAAFFEPAYVTSKYAYLFFTGIGVLNE